MDCIDILKQGAGRDLSEEELTRLMEQVRIERARLKAAGVPDLDEVLNVALRERADRLKVETIARQRAAALNIKSRAEAFDYVVNTFGDRPEDGLNALLSGSPPAGAGSRWSVQGLQAAMASRALAGFAADIELLGHTKVLNSGKLDKQIARALWSLDRDGAKYRGPKEALEIAQVIRKWQEQGRNEANASGAWIGQPGGYIAAQSHDRGEIKRAGFDEWKKDIASLLDMERTLGPGRSDYDAFLRRVFTGLETGEHLRYADAPGTERPAMGNTARGLSRERVLHFKGADEWFQYNRKYGSGNLREAVARGLEHQAKKTALMKALGPDARRNWESLLQDLKKHYDDTGRHEAAQRIRSSERALRDRLAEVDGSLNVPGSEIAARAGQVARALQNANKLGFALASPFGDMPLFGPEFAHLGQGFFRPVLEGIHRVLGDAGGKFSGAPKGERLARLSELDAALEGMSGALAAKYSGEEIKVAGLPGRMQQAYFKLNLLSQWTDSWRSAAGLMMSRGLAARRGMDWETLPKELSRTLAQYGIDSGKWNILRRMESRASDGRLYVTPEGVMEMPDAMFSAYLSAKGLNPAEARARELKAETRDQLRAYFSDGIDYAALQPDAKTRAALRQGSQAGTLPGEAMRLFAQFKSFPTAMFQRAWGCEVYGREADAFTQALRNGNGELAGMARVFLMTTLFGYASMSIKQMIQGKEPRPLNAENWKSTVMAAMLQGGALGVYGDFLFSEMRKSRGGSPLASLLGPTAGSFEQLLDIYGRVKEGDSVAAAGLRVALNHVPGNNLFYIRPVFDHTIGYELFEMINPGYQRRTIERARKEHGQEYWLRPGSAASF